MKTLLGTLSLVICLTVPLATRAQATPAAPARPAAALPSSQGIFSCNQTGAYAMSVGSLSAVGGSFVPVSDSAVTLNTGYLVYKACVLDPLISEMVHLATADYTNAELKAFTTGNNGNPYYVTNYPQESFNAYNQGHQNAFNSVVTVLNPAFRQSAQVAIARGYAQQTQSPYTSLACPYTGDLNAFYQSGSAFNFDGLFAIANPQCDPVYATLMAQDRLDANAVAAQYAWQDQLYNGVYPITDANGNVVTPAFLVSQIAGQATLSGQQQLQNATSIGQMVSAAFAGIASRVLSGALGGLSTYSATYAPQVTAEASQQLGQQVSNTALAILGPALAVEQQYNQTENTIASTVLQAINQLRGSESACWNLIINKVCSATSTSPGGSNTCTTSDGSTLRIATSTAFSQQIVASQLQPLSVAVAKNVQDSNQALSVLNSLIGQVQNTSSPDIQRNAITELDQLVGQGLLHTQPDLDQAKDQATTLNDSLTNTQNGLVPQTIHQWAGDDTTNNVPGAVAWDGSSSAGWCNASASTPGGPATLSAWTKKWGQ